MVELTSTGLLLFTNVGGACWWGLGEVGGVGVVWCGLAGVEGGGVGWGGGGIAVGFGLCLCV